MKNTVKKLISIFFVVSFFVVSVSVFNAVEIKRYYGDIDNDGEVSATDARMALLCALSLPGGDIAGDDYTCGDVDRDGTVTIADARLILKTSSELIPPEYMMDYEFDPEPEEFTKLVNKHRQSYEYGSLSSVVYTNALCEAATKAAEDYCVSTGTAFINSDGSYYYNLLDEENIKYSMADKIIIVSGTNYKAAFDKMIANTQSRKALENSNFTKIGVGGYSQDGRTFYWCVFLIK